MSAYRVVFTYKNIFKSGMNFGVLDRMDIIIERGNKKPTLVIESGDIKIEDRSFPIDCNDVLKKIGEIDFDKSFDLAVPSCFNKCGWELIVDGKKYEGALEDPYYVCIIKKIIRYNAIEVYVNKKLAAYFKK